MILCNKLTLKVTKNIEINMVIHHNFKLKIIKILNFKINLT